MTDNRDRIVNEQDDYASASVEELGMDLGSERVARLIRMSRPARHTFSCRCYVVAGRVCHTLAMGAPGSMRTILLTFVLLLAADTSLAQTRPATQPASSQPAASPAEKELAMAIVYDAIGDTAVAKPRHHVRRASVLAHLALRADSGNSAAWRLLAEANESLGDLGEAARATEGYLRTVNGLDYEATVRWIRYKLAALATAEMREVMLESLMNDDAYSAAVRATAMVNLAAIKEGQGEPASAIKLYRKALEADNYQATALRSLARLEAPIPVERQAASALAMLRSNPLAVNVAWELGQLCRVQGLYDKAILLYDYAQAVAVSADHIPSRVFRRDFLNALLDAGLYERAAAEFASEADRVPLDLGTAGLLVEAYVRLGQTERAESLVERMSEIYRLRETRAVSVATMSAELAWFHLRFRNRPLIASKWAALALQADGEAPFVRRVWAMSALGSNHVEEARQMLMQLSVNDAYAVAALVDEAVFRGDRSAGASILAGAAELGRNGPAWRYLSAIALKHQIPLPGLPQQCLEIAEQIDQFIRQGHLDVALKPEKYLAVTLEPVPATPRVGEPVNVRATLTNIGHLALSLGEWGLVTPKMMLNVEMRTDSRYLPIAQRIPVIWAAPRYLFPGESLEQTVRLDVGPIAAELSGRPLTAVQLSVSAVLDPL
ncbi:MAG: tetratricopeptide repeat protein, partial [Planctomycetes bacterium]|nr:tetratricopeptide repeat protein [Planctomycetota bacterium]